MLRFGLPIPAGISYAQLGDGRVSFCLTSKPFSEPLIIEHTLADDFALIADAAFANGRRPRIEISAPPRSHSAVCQQVAESHKNISREQAPEFVKVLGEASQSEKFNIFPHCSLPTEIRSKLTELREMPVWWKEGKIRGRKDEIMICKHGRELARWLMMFYEVKPRNWVSGGDGQSLFSFSDAVSPASLTAVARAARQVIADHLKSDAEQEQEEREKE